MFVLRLGITSQYVFHIFFFKRALRNRPMTKKPVPSNRVKIRYTCSGLICSKSLLTIMEKIAEIGVMIIRIIKPRAKIEFRKTLKIATILKNNSSS
ncbi:MAG: hypothetical protein KAJ51_09780, partial [Thermoplasmata archaeon]|nr:hypothetical protein [Thermoplasmata archaeon]